MRRLVITENPQTASLTESCALTSPIAPQTDLLSRRSGPHAGHASIQTTLRYYPALEEHSGHPTHAVLEAAGRAATGS